MTSMFVPSPVISVAIKAKDSGAEIQMSKALNRFTREDPTFQCWVDPESNETIIAGMGELHLEVYIERMKREYKAEVMTSPPQVAYRETIGARTEFDYTHKKQTGGSGQYGRVAGFAEPFDGDFEFSDEIKGGSIPREFISSCEKGFKSMIAKSPRLGVPVVGLRVVIDDGQSHAVDSSDIAFQEAARGAFRDFFPRARPRILEPIMKVSMEGPAEFSGNMLSLIMQRRGIVIGSNEDDGGARVDAEVPLAEMFGFSTPLRSATQGKAEFTMEFAKYAETPGNISEELLAKIGRASCRERV